MNEEPEVTHTYFVKIEKTGRLSYAWEVSRPGQYLYATGYTFTLWGARQRAKHYIWSKRPRLATKTWEYTETENEGTHPLWAADGGNGMTG